MKIYKNHPSFQHSLKELFQSKKNQLESLTKTIRYENINNFKSTNKRMAVPGCPGLSRTLSPPKFGVKKQILRFRKKRTFCFPMAAPIRLAAIASRRGRGGCLRRRLGLPGRRRLRGDLMLLVRGLRWIGRWPRGVEGREDG